MIYGLYLSASGVLSNSYRQNVIANNLANSETVGFKRDLTMFRQRLTAAQENPLDADKTESLMENLGGGLLAEPSFFDAQQGDLEETGNSLDVAIQGKGYFAIGTDKGTRLTRDGQFMVDRSGKLILSGHSGQQVLDANQQPITLDSRLPVSIGADGRVTQNGQEVARLGVFDAPDTTKLKKEGGTLLSYGDANGMQPSTDSTLHSNFIERANVDPSVELSTLMDTQRQLEANANMIRYQDETLDKCVNDVGKIS